MKKLIKSLSVILAILIFTSSVFATQNGGIVEKREEKVNANNANIKPEKTEMVSKDKTTMKLVEDNKGHISENMENLTNICQKLILRKKQ